MGLLWLFVLVVCGLILGVLFYFCLFGCNIVPQGFSCGTGQILWHRLQSEQKGIKVLTTLFVFF